MGPPASNSCQSNLDILIHTCAELGIPLATEKLEGPSTTLDVEIDTTKMEIRLPNPMHKSRTNHLDGKKEGYKTPHPITCWSAAER